MLQQLTFCEHGLRSRILPIVTYSNRLAQGQSLSTYQPSIQVNSYYNFNEKDEQHSAYLQGVFDGRYLNIQRQNQLLFICQQGFQGERFDPTGSG